MIQEVKAVFPRIPVVMGGVFPSTQPELAAESEADYIVLGEGEVPMVRLLDYIRDGGQGSLPDGVHANQNRFDSQKTRSYFHPQVDDFPFPARDLVPFKSYLGHSQRNQTGLPVASLITSRGCPFKCEFCSVHPIVGYDFRAHSASRVLEEIDHLVENYGIELFEIEDDNFTLNQRRTKEILEGIIERNRNGGNISWVCHNGLRIDTLKEENIKLIKASGCQGINLALEHGDPEMLNEIIHKKLKPERVMEVVRLCRKYDLPSTVFIIYGYPGETRERFENGLEVCKLLKRANPDLDFAFFLAQPYPGTELFSRAVSEGLLPADLFSTAEKIARFDTSTREWFNSVDFDHAELLRRKRKLIWTLRRNHLVRERVFSILPTPIFGMLRSAYRFGKSKV
jgi:anaerobic magnesium-protoporphyrin IX monomethyl ester cyclase